MTEVAISRLRLRASAGLAAEARQRSEDALRLAALDDDRLLVLRSLDLGIMRPRADPRYWQERTADLIRARRLRALHGSQAGAESVDAVWFHSAEEARALLLLALLTGRGISAWFWRLAVRDWRGFTFRQWWPRLVVQASADPRSMAALARTAMALIEAGHLHAVLDGLGDLPAIKPDTRLSSASIQGHAARSMPILAPAAAATRLVARLEATVRARVVTALSDARVAPAARHRLATLALVASAPDLASRPAELVRLAQSLVAAPSVEGLPEGQLPIAGDRRAASAPSRQGKRPLAERRVSARSAEAAHERSDRRDMPARSRTAPPRPADLPPPEPRTEAAPIASIEQASVGAGLFLLIRPLWRMGVEQRSPQGFGRLLLRHVGQRMRIPPEDPLFARLDAEDDGDADMLGAWRIGADRWLRRTTRRKLVDVVRKPGWLIPRDDGLAVRFRVDAADIRLRRHALDLDPGWVGWLGMVVNYHFRDEPLR